MKPEIHPEYREVLFHDTGIDKYFLIRSTLETTETREWEDGKTYPYYPVEISSASHPFYTGKHKIVDSGGRVDKFRQRYGRSSETEST
ncbi:MAG: 50S ribosomal protein L31 [Gammaproteobacteria bacterium]|jgi:large subunit ribosomal protein L31|nr:50S ribosomal protein L31 [Gammaproteobacteria bacterium]